MPSRPGSRPIRIAILKLLAWEETGQASGRGAARPHLADPARGAAGRYPARRARPRGRRAAGLCAACFPAPNARRRACRGRSPDPLFPPRRRLGASNAWAAAPHRSATGIDAAGRRPAPAVHRADRSGIWPGWNLRTGGVIGATVPGVPAVLQGRSERLRLGPDRRLHRRPGPACRTAEPRASRPRWRASRASCRWRPGASIVEIKDAAPVTLSLQLDRERPGAAARGAGRRCRHPRRRRDVARTGPGSTRPTGSLSALLRLMRAEDGGRGDRRRRGLCDAGGQHDPGRPHRASR